jgi:Histidine kinase-, DNA gyrase B-, and HSP90-like ATPase
MSDFTIKPQVNQAKEFREIASDFGQPLELLREAISNAFDAGATRIELSFAVETVKGARVLKTTIQDNGSGMNRDGLQAFFDLGNSPRHLEKEQLTAQFNTSGSLPIGEKGHGTKVYFNSAKITVETFRDGHSYKAVMNEPYGTLCEGQVPEVLVGEIEGAVAPAYSTRICIEGYNHNQTELFNHERLKDYIYWFTKFGSCEERFGITRLLGAEISLKGLDREQPETLKFGHPLPAESKSLSDLFDQLSERAGDHFCKHFVKTGHLPKMPDIPYQALFCVEGHRVKLETNKMIRRQGKYQAPQGAYAVSERYGIWLCKDFIPVERRNEPVTYRGTEWTKLHAFFNCQALRLSANRGSVQPTPEAVKAAIDEEIKSIYGGIMEGEDMEMLDYFEDLAAANKTIKQEEKDFKKRQERADKALVAIHKGTPLVEPQSEVGVLALMAQLSVLEPDLFGFAILDYDSHSGYDVLVKGDHTTPIQNARKFFVEYKYLLTTTFNHSFQHLKSIVCWSTKLQNEEQIQDIAQKRRTLQIKPSDAKSSNSYTRFFLDDPGDSLKIEVIVLKLFLKERLGLEFKQRDLTSAR